MDESASLARGAALLVGVADIAKRLGVSAERIRQLAKAGSMPAPVGKLGRQLVWQWRDVENWARVEGRSPGLDGTAARVRTVRDGAPLRKVVDELMSWGRQPANRCHVRVWAPITDRGQHVVVLGQLQDNQGRSITSDIEDVAMTAALRYLGSHWRQAQFYEYAPTNGLGDGTEFHHVTFTVEPAPRWRRNEDDLAHRLGGRLVGPSWRSISWEELADLTGDWLAVWTAGTYTAELFTATADGLVGEVIWDPKQARDLLDLWDVLTGLEPRDRSTLGVALALPAAELAIARSIVARAAITALEHSERDVCNQNPEAEIALSPVETDQLPALRAAAALHPVNSFDDHRVWDMLSLLRDAIVTSDHPAPEWESRRRILVPGLRSGHVELAWYHAGVAEPQLTRRGRFGPIATPADLLDSPVPKARRSPLDRLLLLDMVLSEHLEENWDGWYYHDVPRFLPSEPLPADGPLARAYLATVGWAPLDTLDADRLHRLREVGDITRAGLDPEGNLVAATKKLFICEWPVSGPDDARLAEALIRADRPSAHGPTPVFLEHNGRPRPLPSAPHLIDGNAYTWGYPGTGPANLAAAAFDACRRAGLVTDTTADDCRARIQALVRRPSLPSWRIIDLTSAVTDGVDTRPQASEP